ncbi:MAG: helix-turn-helix domain-containing protein [Oscillospiraceae bacterium]|nr:helix-turn-helix domain-containing protein [Oscillospiraceae bacterium]
MSPILRLRELRETSGKKQKDLARELGIANSTLSQYETGIREPDIQTLLQIAKYFEVSIGYLLGADSESFATYRDPNQELSPNEIELVKLYRSSDTVRQEVAFDVLSKSAEKKQKTIKVYRAANSKQSLKLHS